MDEALRAGAAEVMRAWLDETIARGQLPMILITADPSNPTVPFVVMPGPGLSPQEVADVLRFIVQAMQAKRVVNDGPRT